MSCMKKALSMIPSDCKQGVRCVYILFSEGTPVYVGQSIDVARRISQHIYDKKVFNSVEVMYFGDSDIDSIEEGLIKSLSPKYNKKHNETQLAELDISASFTEIMEHKIKTAGRAKGMHGVMDLKEHCGLSYERTSRVYRGDTNAKLADVIIVLESLNIKLKLEDKDEE